MGRIFFTLIISVCIQAAFAQKMFRKWPAGASPQEIGKRVTEKFIQSPHGVYNAPNTIPHIPYFEVCTWYGSLTFASLSNNTGHLEKLIHRFQPLWNEEAGLLPYPDHVDYTVFGAIPLEIFLQTGDTKYLNLGLSYADTQWAKPFGPRVTPAAIDFYNAGYTSQTRLWIDDMYMISLVQSKAYKATNDSRYIERAAKEMVMYLDSLQKDNGLFFHAPRSPFFWGRGNGWMAAAMAELLSSLPASSQFQLRILQGYKKMMASLLQYQAEDGMWRQLVDDPESWKETSATGMFTFAMITGVQHNWLDKKIYGQAARKAWISLASYVNSNAELTNVCEGTGAGNNRQYYIDRKRIVGDMHGQAPLLWCASALMK
jgi:rhamnogalacturonyl hydrolase YesR